jgi:polynucleotide 5'-hydroxyl-kinase GRC3/NOL9
VKLKLQTGHELLVQGPATAKLISGNVSSLAKPLPVGEPLTVRAGRLRIIEATDESELDMIIGQNGKVNEVEMSTIPPEWIDLAKKMTADKAADLRVMVLGGLDTGKNTLITYLANMLLGAGFKVAVMDADMGQGEIGPPATMSVALLGNPIFELLEASPDSIFFVGSTSPSYLVGRVLQGTGKLLNFINERLVDAALLVNMPGWISGQAAIRFVLQMISKINATHLVGLQRENEVEDILVEIPPEIETVRLPVSPYARPRSREERKFLRETSYRKYFLGSKDMTMHYSEIDFSPLFYCHGEEASLKVIKEVENVVRNKVLYCEEGSFSINAIVMGHVDASTELVDEETSMQQSNDVENESDRERPVQKEIRVIPTSQMDNLVVALFDKTERLTSLGILRDLDFRAKRATVSTILKPNELKKIEIGRVKVSRQGYEIGYAEIRRILPK